MSQVPSHSRFQEVIEVVETLPSDDQILLIEIIRRRLIQHRRSELATGVAEMRGCLSRHGGRFYGRIVRVSALVWSTTFVRAFKRVARRQPTLRVSASNPFRNSLKGLLRPTCTPTS